MKTEFLCFVIPNNSFIIVCLWCVAVSHPVRQSSYPPSLRNIAVWSSWYREDPAGQSCGQRQWYALHQHQGELPVGIKTIALSRNRSSLYIHWHRIFTSLQGPELLSKYIGASEQGVRDVFQRSVIIYTPLLFFFFFFFFMTAGNLRSC